jgi:hypothetical protein
LSTGRHTPLAAGPAVVPGASLTSPAASRLTGTDDAQGLALAAALAAIVMIGRFEAVSS